MLLEISIGINPIIFQYKSLMISWHGFFTMVGVLVSVLLVARWAKKENISSEIVYSVAIWGVLSGIIGARLVHVIDRWDYYSQNFCTHQKRIRILRNDTMPHFAQRNQIFAKFGPSLC